MLVWAGVARGLSRSISTTTHGRFLVDVPDPGGAHPLIVGFHGYGETAEAHLEQLRRLPRSSECVLASIRALHLFYTKAGEVVGSWMTKLDREEAIADNVRYVAAAVARLKEEFSADDRLAFVGFSQGASMAYRAATRSGHPCQALLAIGGDMPPDVASDGSVAWPAVLVTRGQRDAYFTAGTMERDLAHLRRAGADVQSVVFDGGHEWTEPVFTAAGALIARALRLPS
jgi:predicted esterase